MDLILDMDLIKLNSADPTVVRKYVTKKFKKFNSLRYRRSTRLKNCIKYYRSSPPDTQSIIESVYQRTFGELFPHQEMEQIIAAEARAAPVRVEAREWLSLRGDYRADVEMTLNKLCRDKEKNNWQEGSKFFNELVQDVAFIDDQILDASTFTTEFSEQCKAEITSSVQMTERQRQARFDMMVGFTQSAVCSFESHDEAWGDVSAKLEESFRAGLWASGSAKAQMDRLGFSSELQAALAIGTQLNLEGSLTWSKKEHSLALGGDAEVFFGAKAGVQAKLTAHALKGIEASIKAGAFAGFSATAKGHCTYSYDGKQIVRVEAKAGVTFGVGAELEASIEAPIFGPTVIAFSSTLSVGLGTTTGATVAINFSEASLAASQEFRKVVYWRTLARGYEMDLMNSDARNLYYLNKAIARLEEELESVDDSISSYHAVEPERRSLLMSL